MINLLNQTYAYFLDNQSRFWLELGRHLSLSGTALAISLLLCIPLGIWAARHVRAAQYLITAVGSLRLIPSLAILFLVMPYLGTGSTPAITALSILAMPSILINVYTGLRGVEPAVIEAASAMGMTSRQRLIQVEIPLALPVMIAGIRTATVEVIASATLAAFIGAGGLGIFVTRGFALFEPRIMLLGAIPVAALALLSEVVLGRVERWFTPPR
ncbi:binding-protein-dependent transport systems inner membrane component [Oscillochloris trichoides DG-6]|uniref:Binding-protein-dependent transport systems inner membrane component n=1 Tax=Oscillochloris trichoides DG-6 TaxID=765420 RepID=E1IEN7_9CHLR|nr:ABC transporter permease [Oscillochloris trichoides]EFO80329.1 binding-protein-dependent transport systems inner membrane component [Oscillochloris trichoides DG-6]